jgi:RHS repeat-associated protein
LSAGNPNNGTNTIDPGEVWDSYDNQGRLSSVVDWNGDAFTYGYDCSGDVAWMAETPSSTIPTVTPCEGSSGSVPTPPTPSSGTDVITSYTYTTGATGNLPSYETTSAVTSSGSSPLLGFGSSSSPLAYDERDYLTNSTPYVNGTAQTADTYTYDSQQRVASGPETSGSKTSYSYANSNTDTLPLCSKPFCSTATDDQMGIDASPLPGSTAQLGEEYSGNGELCWVAESPSSSSGSCGTPSGSASTYDTYTYNASGERTATTPTGYGANSALTWDQDTGTLTCINTDGTTCTTPGATTTSTANYTYNGDGLRMTAATWNTSTSSVQTTGYTWGASSALLSDGTYDYIYGLGQYSPIAQIDSGDAITSDLVSDSSSSVRGIVEVTSSASDPDQLVAYIDYDSYGNPITGNGGSADSGGLTNEEGGDPDSLTRFGFGGGFSDSTGLTYFVNRYYDPMTGQFISVDPELGSTGTPYAYAGDDSIQNQDPMGLTSSSGTCFKSGSPFLGAIGPGILCLKYYRHRAVLISKPNTMNEQYLEMSSLYGLVGTTTLEFIIDLTPNKPGIDKWIKQISDAVKATILHLPSTQINAQNADDELGYDTYTAMSHAAGCNVFALPKCRNKINGYPCSDKIEEYSSGIGLCWGDSSSPTILAAEHYDTFHADGGAVTLNVGELLTTRNNGKICDTNCVKDGLGVGTAISVMDYVNDLNAISGN